MFDFKIVYIPGVSNLTPDFGSRHPSKSALVQDQDNRFSRAMYSMFAAMQIEPDDPVDEKECMSFCAPVFLPMLENAFISFKMSTMNQPMMRRQYN